MEARKEDGQALLLALGGAFALIAAALALVAIAGAVTGKGRAQRAADLAAISAARSMRDDLPRLLAPPALPTGCRIRRTSRRPTIWPGRASRRSRRRRRTVSERSGWASPFPTSARSRRSAPRRSWAAGSTARAGEAGGGDVEASAVAEAAAPASRTGSMPAMATGGGYSGPLVYRDGGGDAPRRRRRLRPHGRGRRGRRARPRRQLRLPLRRRTGGALRRPSDPTWVAPPGPLAAPLRDRARPRAGIRLRLAGRQRQPLRLRPALFAGRPGTTATTARPPPCSAAGNAVGAAAAGGGERRRRRRAPALVRPGRISGRRIAAARRATGTSPPPCSPPS